MAEQVKKEAAQEGRTALEVIDGWLCRDGEPVYYIGHPKPEALDILLSAKPLTLEEANAAVREYLLTSGCTPQSGKPGETPQSRWGQ